MTLVVKKFGGTSVGSVERIIAVANQIVQAVQREERLIIVLSAMSGETDRLLRIAHELSVSPEPRELAALLTTGEQVTTSLLAMTLCHLGLHAKSLNALQVPIHTDNIYTKASISEIDTKKLQEAITSHQVVVVAGFQGMSPAGEFTTLGRGGSDTTAVALACALKADECQIYTDVEGIYTADPRLVPKAYLLSHVPFKTMLELASTGSKVLQWRSVALAAKYQLPVRVLSSFKPGIGTLINDATLMMESPVITSLSHQMQLTRFVLHLPNRSIAGAEIAATLAGQHLVVDYIKTKALGEFQEIILYINREDKALAQKQLTQYAKENGAKLFEEAPFARISLVGIGLHAYPQVAAQFFETFLAKKISIEEIIYSELVISAIIQESALTSAARALHQTFFEK